MYDYFNEGSNAPTAVSPWHAGVDAGASYIAIYGGFPGAALSAAYFIASPVIWFSPDTTHNYGSSTVDNTYVAPPRLK